MEEVLRQMLLIFGGLAIAGIFVHGMWTIRKKPKAKEQQSYEPRDWSYEDDAEGTSEPKFIDADIEIDADDPLLKVETDNITDLEPGQYDDLGLGEVRVLAKQPEEPFEQNAAETDLEIEPEVLPQVSEVQSSENDNPEDEFPKPKIYSSVVTQPKPEFEAEQQQALKSKAAGNAKLNPDEIPEPPTFLLKKEQAEKQPDSKEDEAKAPELAEETTTSKKSDPVEKVSLAEQAINLVKRKKAEPPMRKRKEPKVREDQMRIDFDEPEAPTTESHQDPSVSSEPQQEVLILNVKTPDDAPIPGSALLPMLLTLGFKFGDQDIFHRHVNSNGKGPVLFSLANMFKPGNFDIDNLENFTTQGVSLFMILPIEGDPHQVFNMMHNAARKIADEFSAQILDGRRSALNKQNLQQYVEKIREFERMRMIAR